MNGNVWYSRIVYRRQSKKLPDLISFFKYSLTLVCPCKYWHKILHKLTVYTEHLTLLKELLLLQSVVPTNNKSTFTPSQCLHEAIKIIWLFIPESCEKLQDGSCSQIQPSKKSLYIADGSEIMSHLHLLHTNVQILGITL